MGWRLLVVGVLTAGGCLSYETKVNYPADLHHPNYVKRSKAVAEFARRQDQSQLPDAFSLLLDEDANIRLVVHETIREMTPDHDDKGYLPYLPADVRYGIVIRWQASWEKAAGAGAIEPAESSTGEQGAGTEEPGAEEPAPAESGEAEGASGAEASRG